jgi:hypothetical protein
VNEYRRNIDEIIEEGSNRGAMLGYLLSIILLMFREIIGNWWVTITKGECL